MICIRGAGSSIVEHLIPLLPEEHIALGRADALSFTCKRYLFCQGLLLGKRAQDQSNLEMSKTFLVNAGAIIAECDDLIENNDHARICVIGSESGFAWSYDGAYAAAKAALHRYVETKKLRTEHQQMICVAPSIIGDAGMTTRRKDGHSLMLRAAHHPKKRFLRSEEVARLIHYLLYVDAGYISGVTIRMNGGEHTCR